MSYCEECGAEIIVLNMYLSQQEYEDLPIREETDDKVKLAADMECHTLLVFKPRKDPSALH